MPRGSRKNRKKRSIDHLSKEQDAEVTVWPPQSTVSIPPPVLSVEELNNDTCSSRFQSLNNIESPTLVQRYTWPVLAHSRSCLIAIAPTGSGKTFAYGLPLECRTLVMTPTRELTQQVSQQLNSLPGLQAVAIYGGRDDKHKQIAMVQASESWNVLVATPGRLLDVLESDEASLPSDLDTIVLDEADRLAVDGSLREQVSTIIRMCPRRNSCRVVLVSATHPDTVTQVWKTWLTPDSPTVIIRAHTLQISKSQGQRNSKSNTSDNNTVSLARIPSHIQQVVQVCSDHKRRKKLLRTLQAQGNDVGIIFFAKIQTLMEVARFLRQHQQQTQSITVCHGQLSQDERDHVLKKPFQWLLATDLAARGIHCEHIQFVIQFDFPSNLEQYVHRCGRIRGGTGRAYAFFSRRFRALAGDLVELLESCGQTVDPNLQSLVKKPPVEKKKQKRQDSKPSAEYSSDEDEFAHLSGQRIVLKRDPNVSEASASDSSSGE